MPDNKFRPRGDLEDRKVPPLKYNTISEAWQDGDTLLERIGNTVKETALGRNTVGRIFGIGLDVAGTALPGVAKVNELREKGKVLLGQHPDKFKYQSEDPMIGNALRRALTTDGGSLIRVRDEDGKISTTAILATVVRLAILVGIGWAAQQLGVTMESIQTIMELG